MCEFQDVLVVLFAPLALNGKVKINLEVEIDKIILSTIFSLILCSGPELPMGNI